MAVVAHPRHDVPRARLVPASKCVIGVPLVVQVEAGTPNGGHRLGPLDLRVEVPARQKVRPLSLVKTDASDAAPTWLHMC